ncbi:MAG: hypothetical protein AABO58_12055 [Acidobacteriota bacterium]
MFMPVIVSLGFFAMVVWIVWLGTNSKNRRAQAQVEVQTKLIERFGTSKEFIEFLQSPAGRQFVTGVEVTSNLYARDRIVSGFGKGIVISLLGLGFLAIWIFDDNRGFLYPGFILLGLGVGFFLSTLLTIKLSKSYGLIDADRSDLSVSGS